MQTPEYQQQPQASYPFSQQPPEGNYPGYQQQSQPVQPQQSVQPPEGNHPGYQQQAYGQYAQQPVQPPMYAPQQPPVQQPYYPPQPGQQQFMPPAQPYQQPYPPVQPYQQPYPPAQPYQQQQPAAPYMSNMVNNVNINVQQKGGPGFLIRAIYFMFIGWWLGLFWLQLGFALCAMIITLPIGLIMLNRLPQVLTLKPAGTSTQVNISSTMMQGTPGQAMMVNNISVNVGGTVQHSFLIRALYFIFIGCWVGYIWANLAYLCFVSIILIPVGVLMLDRLPAVLTLRKN